MRLAFGIILLLVGAAAAFGGGLLLRPRDNGPANLPTIRFDVPAPADVEDLALSPDGRYLAYVARAGTGPRQLYVRPVDALESRLLAGTEGAAKPFWSPDSRSIGFSVPRALKRVSLAGGSPLTICVVEDAPDELAAGGAWKEDEVVLFGARRRALSSARVRGHP